MSKKNNVYYGDPNRFCNAKYHCVDNILWVWNSYYSKYYSDNKIFIVTETIVEKKKLQSFIRLFDF